MHNKKLDFFGAAIFRKLAQEVQIKSNSKKT